MAVAQKEKRISIEVAMIWIGVLGAIGMAILVGIIIWDIWRGAKDDF